MRREVALAVTLISMGVCVESYGQCECDVAKQAAVSGTITYRFAPGEVELSEGVKEDFRVAASEWSGAFASVGSNVSLARNDVNGQWVIYVSSSVDGWMEARGQYNQLIIHPSALSQNYDWFRSRLRHELGHVLGFGATNCSKAQSVMAIVQPWEIQGATVSLGCGDYYTVTRYYYTPPPPPSYCENNGCTPGYTRECNVGGDPQTDECGCCFNYTPILIDVDGDGVRLSGAAQGVRFDINGLGVYRQISWPVGTDDSWLVWDRDSNGTIDSGAELFGNTTRLLDGRLAENGYSALSELDGNLDGWLTPEDRAYSYLALWRDLNRDGRSTPQELVPLMLAGVDAIATRPSVAQRRDRWGNLFRYRSKVLFARPPFEKFSYDVFLVGGATQ